VLSIFLICAVIYLEMFLLDELLASSKCQQNLAVISRCIILEIHIHTHVITFYYILFYYSSVLLCGRILLPSMAPLCTCQSYRCLTAMVASSLVLSNIEPPALRRIAATDKLLTQAECHSGLPLYDYVFHPPLLRLKSRTPLWRDPETIDVTSR